MFKNLLKLLLCAAVFLSISLPIEAQQPILFDHIGIEKGLSQTSVLSITQDAQGFMWFGTRYGLNRYDGYTFKVYKYADHDSTTLSNNYVTSLFSDSRKNLWVGTSNGLNLYHEKSDSFKRILTKQGKTNGLTSNVINCFTEDRKGNIWIGTLNGLNLLVGGKVTQIKQFFNNKLGNGPYHNVRSIMEDSAGNIWVGTSNGLIRMSLRNGVFEMRVFKNTGKPGDISEDYISNIIEDNLHRVWVSTQSKGLNLFVSETENFKIFKHSNADSKTIVSNTIRNMALDDAGKLWIGTLDGISIMEIKNFTCANLQYDPDNKSSLNHNSVHRLYKDKNGSVWVGTYFGGININYPYTTAFTIHNRNNRKSTINNNVISGFAEDKNQNLWIGTEGGGLNYFDKHLQKFSYFKNTENQNSIQSNLIKKILLDRSGRLWIGTHSGGLDLYDLRNKTFKNFKFSSALEDIPDEIIAIVEDKKNCLWVATQRNGIKVSNPEKTQFKSFNLPKSFSKSAKVKSFMASDRIYFGTTSGLFIYNQEKQQFYSLLDAKTRAPLGYYVNCILETQNKEIYLGTYHSGLIEYNQKTNKIITYTTKNGLPNDDILGILEDEKGHLWISTTNGLSMFNRTNKTFKNYTIADGLPGNEFNTNAFFKSKNNELYFGGFNGFINFYPDNIQTNVKRAIVVLTDLKVDNKVIKINGRDGLLDRNITLKNTLVFASDQNTFSLNFALLNFIKPEKNSYAYKLKGFEKNWNYVNSPTGTYTNLPPGSYTFLVKGINNDGIDSANIKEITIIVNPPFYRTWWAYLFYFCVVAAILFIVVRYLLIRAVLKKEKEVNAHKLEFFTNISHEIRTPLTLIVGPLDKLIENTKDNPALNRDLQPIKNNADRLMKLVSELLDFRKAESGKMDLHVSPGNIIKFCKEIFMAFQNMATSKEIAYSFTSEKEEIIIYFDKVQMEKVLFNLLSNAFKFTPNRRTISLTITADNQFISIKICDNGIGIPLENQSNLFNNFYQANASNTTGTGLGLSFSKSIVELHHGSIIFQSAPETMDKAGATCFSIILKSGKEHFKPSDLIQDYVSYDNPVHYNLPEAIKVEREENGIKDQEKKKYNILLVEDNEDVSTFIKNALQEKYQVYVSDNGLKGLEKAMELIPDLVISDVMMPVMDGLTLCHKLKTDERTSHIPVVLLTARSAYIHQINGFENGADAYIMKPFNLIFLELNIHNLLKARETIRRKFIQVINLEPKNMVINTTESNFLHKIIAIIEEHISDPEFDVPTLSLAIGMSQPVLYKKIRALTDLSVNDFIKSWRLKRAAQFLKSGQISISNVAYAVGFNDRKYFSISFKKYFGKSPSDYIQDEN